MLRITAQKSAAQAKRYFSRSDYFIDGQELAGHWHGSGADRLGLTGEVRQADFDAICDNRHPLTHDPLTARHRHQRRVGWDLTFDVPKDVSVLHAISGDQRIEEAFRLSVRETMHEIEAEITTRVRRGGQNGTQTTGNLVWAEFLHRTSRPTAEDHKPDPHLHLHAYVFNATFCTAENRWQAIDLAGIVKDSAYWRGVADARLASRLDALGYPVERRGQQWGIAGVPTSVREKFSRRTREVEDAAMRLGVTDPAEKATLGARTRRAKDKSLAYDELREYWRERLTDAERESLTRQSSRDHQPERRSAAAILDQALSHCLTRDSVVRERDLLAKALQFGIGSTSPESLRNELANRTNLRRATFRGHAVVTTPEVLAEEKRMLDFARSGAGQVAPIQRNPHTFRRSWLNADQKAAVHHVLTTTDRVTIIRGAAGVGKSTLSAEAAEAISAAGKRVVAVAPTAAARDVLRADGFPDAQTVAAFLQNQAAQQSVSGQVLWVDEASLVGVREMTRLFDVARDTGCRVVLSGDTAQHHSVARGDALRLLQARGGVQAVEVREITRQRGAYKQAVGALARGDTEQGLAQLERLGWVREIADAAERRAALTAEYLAASRKGSVLVVAPTHAEGDAVTAEIRDKLRITGRLGTDQQRIRKLTPMHWTDAEKQDASRYISGQHVLHFHQNAAGGVRRGMQQTVTDDRPVPTMLADRFEVYAASELAISEGDRVRITANGSTADGRHRLTNGTIYTVSGFTAGGDIVFRENGWIVSKNYGFLAHGYAVTSHASQGRTVDHVLLSEPAASLGAASREQFYVSVSRGKHGCTVYTDDRAALAEAVSQSDSRITATEVWAKIAEESQQQTHRTQQVMARSYPQSEAESEATRERR
ncbi:MobF family relaxase [Tuwongella immobilis]|uniref:AAA+ ATPase domain-containing protein n=1 Tax=Tuwongella immobilis TaxID=692036 RepID=A0A6C2YUA3_9BACT|nr:MobF family relaxase [Tuwongella immobilis]VIP05318.1 Conjugative relaxase domain protein OS=Mucilaginibacter paludis DSM 18603 GN=Mucpa_5696 PE=4 SV=1: TrwC: AAA_30: UvrD_C_2 [Tuwongella immobilis]VTS07992.1 Conjugative relaxase domain protein OS=Mucilaginibacter paludis DSM 18603 GN=Mucpa_5696 PE=4 SV=1: TrwC: AAA_30: UvrD_C_2 [Tuwongella immobilis]